ncbi:MAG: hypothetical protein GF387_01580 [Candidatus Portnoybacteria bacterium]|nr:hypothetical protein [Candidatus Portnoybacteria bacterium]
MKKTTLIIIIITIAIIFFLAGLIAGKALSKNKIAYYEEIINTYNPQAEEITSLTGEVIQKTNESLTIKTKIQDPYKLPQDWEEERIIIKITDETKILKLDPDRIEEKQVAFSEIEEGARISINSKEDVRNKAQVQAESIYILENE